ncbi:MAG: hypothetical protein WDW38_005277 [Sanguina aurantia]
MKWVRAGCHVYQAYSGSRSAQSSNQYFEPGPFRHTTLPPINLSLGNSLGSGEPVRAQLTLTVPEGQLGCPLIVFSAGFLLDASLYRSYAQDFAAAGYAVALYDLSEVVDDITHVSYLWTLVNTCLEDRRLSRYTDPSTVILAGHSRGGKLSALAAAVDPRVSGLLLLDPVDNTSMTPSGPGYPSCMDGLGKITASPRSLPMLVVGAALNRDVIPAEGNYTKVIRPLQDVCAKYEGGASPAPARGPLWDLELSGAGHLQFLDKQVGLLSLFSSAGPTSDDTVRRVSKAAMLAWCEAIIRPSLLSGSRPDPGAAQRTCEDVASACQALAPLKSNLRTAAGQSSTSNSRSTTGSSNSSSRTSDTRPPRASSDSSSSSRGNSPSSSSSSWSRSGSSSGSSSAGAGSPSGGPAWSRSSPSESSGDAQSSQSYGDFFGAGSGAGSSAGAGARGPASAGAAGPAKACPGASRAGVRQVLSEDYSVLKAKRAREIKAMLVERGIDCSDCFEKEDLLKRVLRDCVVPGAP